MDSASKLQAEAVFAGFGERKLNGDNKAFRPPGRDDHLLIQPKKLVNPVLESRNHVTMQNELKLNSKLGINVLNQKSELSRVFQEKKREQHPVAPQKSEFEIMLEKRRQDNDKTEESEAAIAAVPEFVKMKDQLRKN